MNEITGECPNKFATYERSNHRRVNPDSPMEQWTLFNFRKSWDLQGRYYAYRFGEPTDIEPRNELKIPASRPASAGTPVRLLLGATCVCLLSASIATTASPAAEVASVDGRVRCFREKVVYVPTYGECPNPCRTRSGSVRRAARRLRGDCRVLRPPLPLVCSHCGPQRALSTPCHRQEPSRGNCIAPIRLNKRLMTLIHAVCHVFAPTKLYGTNIRGWLRYQMIEIEPDDL